MQRFSAPAITLASAPLTGPVRERRRTVTILCLGEAIADLICERELEAPEVGRQLRPRTPGGALANVAVAIARAGGDAALLGGVGDDF